MIALPPGEPATMMTRPARSYTIVGAIDERGRLLGSQIPFGTLGAVAISNVVLQGAWANHGMLYVLWVDDNGNGGGDGWYGFDDVSFAKATPPTPTLPP